MYLHGEVETREGIGDGEYIFMKIFIFIVAEEATVFSQPKVVLANCIEVLKLGLVRSEAAVGTAIGKMVSYSQLDVFIYFDQGWAKIFVAVNDEEVQLAAEAFQGIAVGEREVCTGRTCAEHGAKAKAEVAQSVRKDLRKEFRRRVPCGG